MGPIGLSELIILAVLFSFIAYIIFWLRALVDVSKNEFTGNNKIIWLLVVIFIPFGMVIYFVVGRKQRVKGV